MRSVRYRLFSIPTNRDDCIIYSSEHPVDEIKLNLHLEPFYGETFDGQHLCGTFNWKFDNRLVKYRELYSGYLSTDTFKNRYNAVQRANSKLELSLNAIKRNGLTVLADNLCFYSSENAVVILTLQDLF